MTLLARRDSSLDHSQIPDRALRFSFDPPPEAVSDFDRLGKLSAPSRAAVLFKEGDLCRNVIFVRSGEVKLSTTSSRGRILILKIARAGDLLGLAAAISASRHEMTAETLVPTIIRTIPSDDFLNFMERHRSVRIHMVRLLAEDCKSAFLDVRSFAYSSAPERLASILLNWGRAAVAPEPHLNFDMTLTHDELGSLAGLSPRDRYRVLGEFQKKKLIAVHGASFLILEPSSLAALLA